MKQQSGRSRGAIPWLAGSAVVLLVVAGLVWLIAGFMKNEPEKPKRQVAQVVKLIRPPPPPPEPPPPPPPEEKIEEPLQQETPEDAPPDDAPPAEQLGLDADGVAGSDGFGLAARRGGRELGLGGNAFGWYTNRLRDSILDALSDDERVRRGKYQVTVRVWLARDGAVERIKLDSTSGDRSVDSAIEQALQRMARAPDAPPLEMPQPVILRVVTRG